MDQQNLSERNFLYVHLGDNDYGWQLNTACSTLLFEYGYTNEMPIDAWVLAVVSLVNAFCIARDAESITSRGYRGVLSFHNSTLDYLATHVSASYMRKQPKVDDGGGSVVVDFNVRAIWNT